MEELDKEEMLGTEGGACSRGGSGHLHSSTGASVTISGKRAYVTLGAKGLAYNNVEIVEMKINGYTRREKYPIYGKGEIKIGNKVKNAYGQECWLTGDIYTVSYSLEGAWLKLKVSDSAIKSITIKYQIGAGGNGSRIKKADIDFTIMSGSYDSV